MAHKKVYGFCESGCRVEVDPKDAVKGIRQGGTGATSASGALKNITESPGKPARARVLYSGLEKLEIVTASCTTEELALAMQDMSEVSFVNVKGTTPCLTDAPENYGYITISRGYNTNYINAWFHGTTGNVYVYKYHTSEGSVNEWKQIYHSGNVIPVNAGGTGATDAATARAKLGITLANLGAASTSHNHSASNITSGTLPIERGGTGATDAATARAKLGITPANLGAVKKSGDTMTGPLTLGDGQKWVPLYLAYSVSGVNYQGEFALDEGRVTLTKRSNGTAMNKLYLNDENTTLMKPLTVSSGGTGATSASGALKNLTESPGKPARARVLYSGLEKLEIVTANCTTEELALAMQDMSEVSFVNSKSATPCLTDAPENYGYITISRGYNTNYINAWFHGTTGNVYVYKYHTSEGSVNEWKQVYHSGNVIPVNAGGTGAKDAATARKNLGAVGAAGDTMTGSLTIKNTKVDAPDVDIRMIAQFSNGNHEFWRSITEDGDGVIGYKFPDGDHTRVWLSKDAFWFDKPLTFDGSTNKERAEKGKQTLKNCGLEIQCGTVDDVGTSGKAITFPEAFSGVPVVTATGGSEVASVYVRDVTATGFKLYSGASNNDGVQWQAIYISN